MSGKAVELTLEGLILLLRTTGTGLLEKYFKFPLISFQGHQLYLGIVLLPFSRERFFLPFSFLQRHFSHFFKC